MRNVGLDLGVRHIAYCEVKNGKVIDRFTVRRFSQLASRIGPDCAPAQVAFEACREGWHVHDEACEATCFVQLPQLTSLAPATPNSLAAERARPSK